jgi:hypothetical protein
MRRVLSLIAVLGLASAGQTANAEDVEKANREQLHQWAGCIAKKSRRLAGDIVLERSGAMVKAVNGGFFFQPDCSQKGKNVSFSGMSFFGPMAEFVLRSNTLPKAKRDPWQALSELELTASDLLKKLGNEASGQQYQMAYLGYLGVCLNKRNTEAASHLLDAKVGSSEETRAVEALNSDIRECRWPGYTYDASYDELRGAVATARFRLAHLASRKAD